MTFQSSNKTLWPNVLILLQKRQRSRQVTGHVQSDSRQVMNPGPELSSLLLLHARPPFLPRREWTRGTQLHVQTMHQNLRAVHVYGCQIMYRRTAVHPSPAGPVPPKSVLPTCPMWVKPQNTAHISGPVTPQDCSKALVPRIWTWATNVEMRWLISPGLSFNNYKMKMGISKTLIKNE